jgi:hypothetical protein
MNLKDLGKNSHGCTFYVTSSFAYSDWGKSRETSVRIVGVPAEIRKGNLPNLGNLPHIHHSQIASGYRDNCQLGCLLKMYQLLITNEWCINWSHK